jgi:uncharacterized repeat protein (TIGR03809 family)
LEVLRIREAARVMRSGTPVQTSVESVRKWHALAERRRRHFVELYRSERWRRYYSEEAFLSQMRDVIQNVETWDKVLGQNPREDGEPAKPVQN